MKTLIIFLLASCFALSQTREPEQAQINLFGTPNYLSDEINLFLRASYQDFGKKSVL